MTNVAVVSQEIEPPTLVPDIVVKITNIDDDPVETNEVKGNGKSGTSDEVGDLNGILFFVNYTKRLIAFRADSGPTPSIYSINVLTNHIFSL